MSASARDLIYGRRGGGWVDKATKRATAAPKKDADPDCKICGRPYSAHGTDRCPVCGDLVEHHTPERSELEWEGRARMATARRDAGIDLNEVDREALRRHPDVAMVGASS